MAVDTAAVDIVVGTAVAHHAGPKFDRLAGRTLVSPATAAAGLQVQIGQIIAGQIVRRDVAVVAF